MQWGDVATCEKLVALGCPAELAAKGTTATASTMRACAAALPTADCHPLVAFDTLPEACTPPGTLEAGEACAGDLQCASGHCAFADNSACGKCKERGKESASCSGNDDCEDGLLCRNYACRRPGEAGDSCSSSRPCAPWLACDQNGKCRQGDPEGTRCADRPDSPDTCDRFSGVMCNQLLMSCKKVGLAAAGEDCFPLGTLTACGGQTQCDSRSFICTPLAQEGELCSVTGTTAPLCAYPGKCVNGLCEIPDPAACE